MNRDSKSIPQGMCFLKVPAARNRFRIMPSGSKHVDDSCMKVQQLASRMAIKLQVGAEDNVERAPRHLPRANGFPASLSLLGPVLVAPPWTSGPQFLVVLSLWGMLL